MIRERDIVYETSAHWVLRVAKGFDVLRTGVTHSTRVAFIGDGPGPNLGLARAISEADKRDAAAK